MSNPIIDFLQSGINNLTPKANSTAPIANQSIKPSVPFISPLKVQPTSYSPAPVEKSPVPLYTVPKQTQPIKTNNPLVDPIANFLKTTIQPIKDNFQNQVSKLPVPTLPKSNNTGYPNNPDPEHPYQNLTDILQGPSLAIGKFLIEPAYNMASSVKELTTGKSLPKLTIPAFTKNMGNFTEADSYQNKYNDLLTKGVPEKDAYKEVLWTGLNDALMLSGPVESGLKMGVREFIPNKLIKPSITTVPKETLFDYFSGRKTPEQLGLSSDLTTKISEKMKTLSTPEKVDFLKGFDLLEAKPSTVGKIFGVTDQEAKDILAKSFGGPVRTASSGALPGQREVPGQAPSMGLSTKEVENIGYGDKSVKPYIEKGNLTTKILKDLEGKTTVSKQYILDATNRGELKQTEREITRDVLDSMNGDVVNVADFAKKVKAELLPLTTLDGRESGVSRYENVSLPEDKRGNVQNYYERIYESPIKTSAGDTHFSGQSDNYFGHTRVEDMAKTKGDTRRVIEVQSDLYQKGNLEENIDSLKESDKIGSTPVNAKDMSNAEWKNLEKQRKIASKKAQSDVSKLQQYTDPTAHFRMVREEIKKAAEDGKTKLQFPTGETAMKIEGLGQSTQFGLLENGRTDRITNLTPEKIKEGEEIKGNGMNMIITKDLGDGKFVAVDKFYVDNQPKNWKFGIDNSLIPEGGPQSWVAINKVNGKREFQQFTFGKKADALDFLKRKIGADNPDVSLREIGSRHGEQFDISGKVDTNNPIYRFYEKDLGRYLTNKYGAKIVVDSKGEKWYELPITKEIGKQPVEAFKKAPLKWYPLGNGPKVAVDKVSEILKDIIPPEKIKYLFNPDLLKTQGALGKFHPNKTMIALDPRLKPIIELYEKNGQTYINTVYHEAYHYLESNFAPEFVAKLDKITEELMTPADHQYYNKYKPEERMAELRADEFAKEQMSKNGYTSRFHKVLEMIRDAIKKIIEAGKKVVDSIRKTPNKEGGFIDLFGKESEMPAKKGAYTEEMRLADIKKGEELDKQLSTADGYLKYYVDTHGYPSVSGLESFMDANNHPDGLTQKQIIEKYKKDYPELLGEDAESRMTNEEVEVKNLAKEKKPALPKSQKEIVQNTIKENILEGKIPDSKIKEIFNKNKSEIKPTTGKYDFNNQNEVVSFIEENKDKPIQSSVINAPFVVNDLTIYHLFGKKRMVPDIKRRIKLFGPGLEIAESKGKLVSIDSITDKLKGITYYEIIGYDPKLPNTIIRVKLSEQNKNGKAYFTVSGISGGAPVPATPSSGRSLGRLTTSEIDSGSISQTSIKSQVRENKPALPKVQKIEEAVARAKDGEDFGPRENKPVEKKIPEIKSVQELLPAIDFTNIPPDELQATLERRHDELLQKYDQYHYQIQHIKEILDEHPGKILQRFISRKTGQFEDFKNPNLASTEVEKNKIIEHNRKIFKIAENAFAGTQWADQFDSPDAIREVIDEYKNYSKSLKNLKEEVKTFNKDLRGIELSKKDLKVLDRMAKREAFTEMPRTLEDVNPPSARGGIKAPKLNFDKWKDKGTFNLSRDTFDRNVEKVAPREDATKVNEFLGDHIRANETNRIKDNNAIYKNFEEAFKVNGIKSGFFDSKDSRLIQLYGEDKINQDELKELDPNNWQGIKNVANFARKFYDDYLDKWNLERKKFGYQPVPKRKDYFTHLEEVNWWTRNYGFLDRSATIPTQIAGQTQFFKPGKIFSRAELRRYINDTYDPDAIAGIRNYIETVSKQLYHIDSIQRGRALEKYLTTYARVAEQVGKPIQLQAFKVNLNEYIQAQLSQKRASFDRAITESFIGRQGLLAIQKMSNLIGKNIIAYNISAASSHLVSLPLNFATVKKGPLGKGLIDTLLTPLNRKPIYHIDGLDSDFLIRRYPKSETFMANGFQKVEQTGRFVIQQADMFKAKLATASKYYELKSQGIAPEEAMRQAGIYAGRMIGDYSYGQRPNILTNKSMHIFAQFQLGMNDAISVIDHDIPYDAKIPVKNEKGEWEERQKREVYKEMVGRYVQWAIFAFLLNETLKKIKGTGKGLDPIRIAGDLLGWTDETAGQNIGQRIGTAGKSLGGELPFTSLFMGTFPMATAISGPIKSFSSGNWKDALTTLVADFASPIGGGLQFKKSFQGLSAFKRGYNTSAKGQATFPIAQTRANFARSLFFGPNSTPEARDYYNKDTSEQTLEGKTIVSIQSSIESEKKKLDAIDPQVLEKVQGIFDKVKVAGFGTEEADNLVGSDNLSDAEYKVYLTMKKIEDKQTLADTPNLPEMIKKIVPIAEKANEAGFGTPEADKIVEDAFPETPEGDKEFSIYSQIVKEMKNQGTPGDYSTKTTGASTDPKVYDQQSIITKVANIAKSLGTDPKTAFDDIFHGDYKITGLKNGQIIVARNDKKESIVKKSLGGTTAMTLDHIKSLELGGNNQVENMWLIPKDIAEEDDKVENLLGKALSEGKITGKQAQEYELRYKKGTDAKWIDARTKKLFDSVGEPYTLENIKSLVL